MKIVELLKEKKVTMSFEVFPPKAHDDMQNVVNAAKSICELKPSFMSVTYGAAGTTVDNSVEIAAMVQNSFKTTALAHLTCVASQKNQIDNVLLNLQNSGVENILALRGDIPENAQKGDFEYAYQLVEHIKKKGDFCIGAACYPEGHVQCEHKADDVRFLKQKVDAGCDFLTTQMFFDNNILYNFLYRIREKGIVVPVVAGIMPVTNARQIERICKLSGTNLPERFKNLVDKFGHNPAAMEQAGIAYACEQIIDLIANDVCGIHIYSMNKPNIAKGIINNLSEILK